MSEQRPYPRTEWEEEQKRDTDDAVERAEEAVIHADAAMVAIMDSSKEIAASTKAVETLTRDALIADNKRFRRRNAVLVFLTSVLILGMGFMIYRDVYITSPQREKIEQQTKGLQSANDKLDSINEFIEEVKADQGGGASPETQAVFKAILETRMIVDCLAAAPDHAAAQQCAIPKP
jgi:hypothetical protein